MNSKHTCIILDDESSALSSLSKLIALHCPELEISAKFDDPAAALQFLNLNNVELIFLDISMSSMSGFEFLEKLNKPEQRVIFTTAHERFAIQAIKHHAVDYLLKPIVKEDLCSAVESAINFKQIITESSRTILPSGRISVPIKTGTAFLKVSEIEWITSEGSYSTLHMINKEKHVISRNIGDLESRLPASVFYRIHKSHIVNIHYVVKYLRSDGFYVELQNGQTLEVARRKKDEFLEVMSALGH